MSDTSTHPTPTHFAAWLGLLGFSAVVLGAHEVTIEGSRSTNEKWVTAGTSCTVAFACLALLASRLALDKFAGKVEACTAIICLGLWSGLLPVIMDPGNNIAQGSTTRFEGEGRSVINANIYFFSWGGFISSLLIVASLSSEKAWFRHFDKSATKIVGWYIFLASAIVVLWTSVKFWRDYNDDVDCSNQSGDIKETCTRTAYAMFAGAFGAAVGVGAILLAKYGCFPMLAEVAVAIGLLGVCAALVGLVTFNTGPGVEINNLYFSCWIACFTSAFLAQSCWTDFRNRNKGESEEEEEKGEDVKDEAEDVKDEAEKEEAAVEAEDQA